MPAEILDQYSLPEPIVHSVRNHNLEVEDLRGMNERALRQASQAGGDRIIVEKLVWSSG
jgi:hypothetical protein